MMNKMQNLWRREGERAAGQRSLARMGIVSSYDPTHYAAKVKIQPEGHEGASVPVILMLHDAPNGTVSKALKKIGQLSVIKGSPVMLRVEDFE